jgi:hypothetical protein
MRVSKWVGYFASKSAAPRGVSVSRGLAGALLIAFAALGAPGAARATCMPALQTISKPVTGPILSNGGAITVTSTGSIAGKPDGVDAVSCPITTLTDSGAIKGGGGAAGAVGGVGVSNGQTISTLSNGGTIGGGAGGNSPTPLFGPGRGGVGVSNSGVISTLANSGKISGGTGGTGPVPPCCCPPGDPICPPPSVVPFPPTPTSGVGGAASGPAPFLPNFVRAPGGAAVSNSGTIGALTNSGTISGGAGGFRSGGAGVSNSGKIGALTNIGVIRGGPSLAGPAGDAIYSAGANASIGPITNSGQIIGNVEIDNQTGVTIKGGSGATFGSLTGGAITIGNGNLTFASGNTDLGDSIAVNGGLGKVTNSGVLRLAASKTVTGNFAQSASGTFDSLMAGDSAGTYGSLTVTKLATLDGRLALNLTGGFTLAAGDSFDLFNFAGLNWTSPTRDFRSLTLDGVGCLGHSRVWSCSNLGGLHLTETITARAFDLNVVAGSDPVPEPSTWVMMLLGSAGLAYAGFRRSAKARTAV